MLKPPTIFFLGGFLPKKLGLLLVLETSRCRTFPHSQALASIPCGWKGAVGNRPRLGRHLEVTLVHPVTLGDLVSFWGLYIYIIYIYIIYTYVYVLKKSSIIHQLSINHPLSPLGLAHYSAQNAWNISPPALRFPCLGCLDHGDGANGFWCSKIGGKWGVNHWNTCSVGHFPTPGTVGVVIFRHSWQIQLNHWKINQHCWGKWGLTLTTYVCIFGW